MGNERIDPTLSDAITCADTTHPTPPTRARTRRRRKTREDWRRLLEALENGASRRGACGVACIHPSTLYARLALDEEFAAEVRRVEAEAEMVCASTLFEAAKAGNAQAAMWWLERRRPEDWSTRSQALMLQRLVRDLHALSDAELVALVDRIEQVIAPGDRCHT